MNTHDRALAIVVAGAAAFAAVLLPIVGYAYTPLEIAGVASRWSTSTVTFGIGWDPNEAWDGAARGAFHNWSQHLSGLTLTEDPSLRGQTDISQPSHLVVFDTNNNTGWFADASFVAVTPVWADGAGTIVDADIVLNGRDHTFSTTGAGGAFDVEAILTHEVGHFVGFDHSGVRGASLYPYVSTADPTPRSLSSDDRAAASSLQPAGETRLTGAVSRLDAAPIRGAQVIAVDAGGHALATALTGADGRFDLIGLEAGTAVRVFAAPLDGPVSAANLLVSGVESDFQTTEHPGGPFSVGLGSQADLGTIACAAKTVTITGLWSSPFPTGSLQVVTVVGTGLDAATTTWAVIGPPGVTINAALPANGGTTWTITVQATPSAALGLRSLSATVLGKVAVEPGCLEVVGTTPAILGVSPSTVQSGDLITVDGSGFQPGAQVRVGGLAASNVQWLSSTRVRCTAPAGAGLVGVVVVNPDGLDAQKATALSYSGAPPPEEDEPAAAPPNTPPTSNNAPGPTNSSPKAPSAKSGGGGGGGGCALAPPSDQAGGLPWVALLSILVIARHQPTSHLEQ